MSVDPAGDSPSYLDQFAALSPVEGHITAHCIAVALTYPISRRWELHELPNFHHETTDRGWQGTGFAQGSAATPWPLASRNSSQGLHACSRCVSRLGGGNAEWAVGRGRIFGARSSPRRGLIWAFRLLAALLAATAKSSFD